MKGFSITVDVDGEAGLPDGGKGYERRLTSRSERAYGITRGLPRLAVVLAEFDAEATFYVPGATALLHCDAIRAVADAGHEIGHHGHGHLRTDGLDPAGERAEIERGLDALSRVCGRRPTSYRSPGWELTPRTLALLAQYGFEVDSSLMGDDRPYWLRTDGAPLLELPVHWTLDDAPHFARGGGNAALSAIWRDELTLAIAEERHLTLTMHPEILGRPHRIAVLRDLLGLARDAGLGSESHRRVAGRVASS